MEPQAALAMQASTLLRVVRRELERVELRNDTNGSGQQNPAFDSLAAALRNEINTISGIVEAVQEGRDLSGQMKLHRDAQKTCSDLFSESLALFVAPAMRELGLDQGASDVAERLLTELGSDLDIPWRHVTTLADSEFFGTASQVIRLRYPPPSIWELPVAVHEFGHFAGRRWPAADGNGSPWLAFRNVQDLGPAAHLEELFADLFAAFVVGPAYVYACLLLRFDPAGQDNTTHPSDRKRAAWLLTALDLLARDIGPIGKDLLLGSTRSLRTDWEKAVTQSGSAVLDVQTAGALRLRAGRLWTAFSAWRRPCDIEKAMVLRADWADGVPPERSRPTSLRDVLNAAWMARLDGRVDDMSQAAAIENWARTLCSQRTA